jgi:maltose alpha-D-glucosyltransferase / alpha-amylase
MVHNFAGEATDCTLSFSPDEGDGRDLVCLQTNERLTTAPTDAKALVLQPYGYRWFRLGGLDEFVHSHAERH